MNQNITIINDLQLPCHYTKLCLPIWDLAGNVKYCSPVPGSVLKRIPDADKIDEHNLNDWMNWLDKEVLKVLDKAPDMGYPTLHFLVGYMAVKGGCLGTYKGKFALQTGYSVDLSRSPLYGTFTDSKNLDKASTNLLRLMDAKSNPELTNLNQTVWNEVVKMDGNLDMQWALRPGIYVLAGEVTCVEPIERVYHPTEVECGEELSKRIIERCFNLGKQVVGTARNLTCD